MVLQPLTWGPHILLGRYDMELFFYGLKANPSQEKEPAV